MTRNQIRTLIVSAQNLELQKREKVDMLIRYLEDKEGLVLDSIPNNSAENADNLLEAILCHINYGECNLDELLDDIQVAIAERSKTDE